MFTTAPRRAGATVGALVLVVTVVLTVLSWQVHARSEARLLDRQLAQVGTLLTNQAAVLQVQLADIGQVAVNTGANPAAFARFAGKQLTETGQSLSLWRLTNGAAEQLAVEGVAPRLPADGAAALAGLQPTGQLIILGILPGEPDRLAYALMPADPNTDLLVYAESPLPPRRRLPVTADSPLQGLDVALYLGRATEPGQLLESTAPTPIGAGSRTSTVDFGNATVTIVGASPTPLTGALSAALPWIVLCVGGLLAVGGAAAMHFVSGRRALAERLAAENDRLYREQRGIAGTLQQALLPDVPDLDGIDVAARYVAGVDALEVGGDWYDVIPRAPGCCVFVVGDVSGSGLRAATTMAGLRFAVRAYVYEGHDIEAVLGHLRGLLDVAVDHQFATVLLGELDATAGRLRLVSAGHFPPLLVTGGRAERIDCPVAPPIGVPAPAAPVAATVRLPDAATLFAFTDGLIERRGEVIDAGLDRLCDAAAAADSRPLARILDEVLQTLSVAGRKDDTVLLGMQWGSRPDGPGHVESAQVVVPGGVADGGPVRPAGARTSR